MKELVLVHGAWHGAWCWDSTLAALSDAGIDARAVELPFEGLDSDAAAVRRLLDENAGEKVVVGHSYGGAVISQAAAGRDDITHLVYLCALMLGVGDNPAEMFAADPQAARIFEAVDINATTGIATFRADRAADVFYNDCPADEAARATARLRPFPMAAYAGVDGEPWRTLDSTYVICTEDRTVPVHLQRAMSGRARTVVEWPTGHSPFINRPDLMVGLLEPLVRNR